LVRAAGARDNGGLGLVRMGGLGLLLVGGEVNTTQLGEALSSGGLGCCPYL